MVDNQVNSANMVNPLPRKRLKKLGIHIHLKRVHKTFPHGNAASTVGNPWAELLAGVAINKQLKEERQTQSAVFNWNQEVMRRLSLL